MPKHTLAHAGHRAEYFATQKRLPVYRRSVTLNGMTCNEYRETVRRAFEELTPSLQEFVALRALKREVFTWEFMTGEQLDALWSSCRIASMMFVERTSGEGLWPHV